MSDSSTSSSSSSDKDVLLIVASVSMALATVALILVVRMLERCLPDSDREENLRQQEKKAAKMKELIEKNTILLTYADWVTKVKAKYSEMIPQAIPVSRALSRSSSRLDPAIVASLTLPNATPDSRPLSADVIGNPSSSSSTSQPVATVAPIPSRSGSGPWCDDCAVCLTEFSNEEKIRELPCNHIYHEECVYSWFVKSKRPVCPLCRYNLQISKIEDPAESTSPGGATSSNAAVSAVPGMEVV